MPLPLVHALSRVLQLPCPSSEVASFLRVGAFSAVRFKRLACCVLCGRLSQPMSPWSGVRVLTVQSGLSLRRTALSLPHLKSPLSSLREPPPSLRDLGKPQLGSWGVWWKRTVTNTWTISLKLSFFPPLYMSVLLLWTVLNEVNWWLKEPPPCWWRHAPLGCTRLWEPVTRRGHFPSFLSPHSPQYFWLPGSPIFSPRWLGRSLEPNSRMRAGVGEDWIRETIRRFPPAWLYEFSSHGSNEN